MALLHAVIHRMRVIPPFHRSVAHQEGAAEEEVCRDFGRWLDAAWRWLWEVDAYGRNAAGKTAA